MEAAMSTHRLFSTGFCSLLLGAALLALAPEKAAAQSCYDLWHERNAIYARNGYCFQTQRAIEEFGRGCFPPFGRLSGGEAARVREIQYWERRNDCPN
jgi:hypothetical protein